MTSQSETISEPATAAPVSISIARQFYWSVRRELWENRSIYTAPLIAAAVVLFAFLLSTVTSSVHMELTTDDGTRHHLDFIELYAITAAVITTTMIIVAVFYCLGALHGERRDRSILFWKSLPVSDLTTVLSKAIIPFVIIPPITFAVIVALQVILLVTMGISRGFDAAASVTLLGLAQHWLTLIYGLVAIALWHAPIYGWLLLVSGWARRANFLWAVLPPAALCIIEAIALRSSHFYDLLRYRLMGVYSAAFDTGAPEETMSDGGILGALHQMDLVKFLSNPGLWTGLALCAAFLAAAIWLRRYREPI
jgi:ABC-2 type transport system permease protein